MTLSAACWMKERGGRSSQTGSSPGRGNKKEEKGGATEFIGVGEKRLLNKSRPGGVAAANSEALPGLGG